MPVEEAHRHRPSVSPDGKLVVYASPSAGHGDIYLLSLDGKTRNRLTSDPNYEGDPAWSPDGRSNLKVSIMAYTDPARGGIPAQIAMHTLRKKRKFASHGGQRSCDAIRARGADFHFPFLPPNPYISISRRCSLTIDLSKITAPATRGGNGGRSVHGARPSTSIAARRTTSKDRKMTDRNRKVGSGFFSRKFGRKPPVGMGRPPNRSGQTAKTGK